MIYYGNLYYWILNENKKNTDAETENLQHKRHFYS